MQKVTVVLPTFNEAENIVGTVRNILLQDIPGLDIIVADDDSKDGTLQKVSEYFSGDSRIRCYKHPPPRGLSPSVADAFDLCDSAILCCMDADGQHRAEDLRKIVERFNDTSVNMVIGSRYVKNGGFAEKWRFSRRFTSRMATWMAQIFLRIPLKDPMSGFFAIRRSKYEMVRPYLNPAGFKIMLETAWILNFSGEEGIVEEPIIFAMRRRGESKLSGKVIFQYLKMLFFCMLKKRSIQRAMR